MTPTFRIELAGVEFSARVRSRVVGIKIEDTVGSLSDHLSIKIDDRNMDLDLPPKGSEIKVSLGYLEQDNTKPPMNGMYYMGSYKIAEIEAGKDTGGRYIEIVATSVDFLSELNRTWHRSFHRKYVVDIVCIVAKSAGFNTEQVFVHDDVGTKMIDDETQDGTNISYLDGLASRVGAVMSIKDNRLIFAPQDEINKGMAGNKGQFYLNEQEALTYRYKTQSRGNYSSVRAKYMDKDKGELVYVRTNPAPDALTIAADDDDTGDDSGDKQPSGVVDLPRTYPTFEEAKNAAIAKQVVLDAALATFSFSAVGDPRFNPDANLTLSGFRRQIPTDWTMVKVTHNFDNSGYSSDVDCQTPGSVVEVVIDGGDEGDTSPTAAP